jgi:hypothetical protein
MSLFATAGRADAVSASGAYIILTAAEANIVGGGDAIYSSGASTIGLSGTHGAWDVVWGSGAKISLTGAEAAIVGGGETISASNSAFSLYATDGQTDAISGAYDVVTLVGAEAALRGSHGASSLTVAGADDAFCFAAQTGAATIAGFDASDTLRLSAADWADFNALLMSGDIAQSGADTVIRLDANNAITLTGVQTSSLTAAQFVFS